jgi:hypothetical protein
MEVIVEQSRVAIIILCFGILICACHERTQSQQSGASEPALSATTSAPPPSVPSDVAGQPVADPCSETDEGEPIAKPSIDGLIAAVNSDQVTVEASQVNSTQSRKAILGIVAKTRMCTVYGGYVAPGELAVGQKVRVWIAPAETKDGLAVAATIVLASTQPGDDWP